MGIGFVLVVFLALILLALVIVGLFVIVIWETISIYLERRSIRLTLRKFEVGRLDAKSKLKQSSDGATLWDRQLDG
jgi:uncharacterized membrane protein YqjE